MNRKSIFIILRSYKLSISAQSHRADVHSGVASLVGITLFPSTTTTIRQTFLVYRRKSFDEHRRRGYDVARGGGSERHLTASGRLPVLFLVSVTKRFHGE